MSPTSDEKEKQVAFTMSKAEHAMLTDLAKKEEMSMAALMRLWIRVEYLKLFPDKRPGALVPMTMRGFVNEMSGGAHYTVGNIAKRMGIPHERLGRLVRRVADVTSHKNRPILEAVDGSGPTTTWELLVSREEAIKAIESIRWDPDEPFHLANPDAEDK